MSRTHVVLETPKPPGPVMCPVCLGLGKTEIGQRDPQFGVLWSWEPCMNCNGKGNVSESSVAGP